MRSFVHVVDSGDHSVECSFGHLVGGQLFIIDVLVDACHMPWTTEVGWCGAWLRAGMVKEDASDRFTFTDSFLCSLVPSGHHPLFHSLVRSVDHLDARPFIYVAVCSFVGSCFSQ